MSENKPLVSVLMTAYNREKYISEAIESVLASTYENWELIIVDDGSKDSTVNIARKYELKDGRIKVYVNDQNITQFRNRNKAASYAKGEYLKYVDSDDIIYPFTLQKMVEGMEEFPDAAAGFCLTHGPCKKPLPYKITSTEAFQQHFLGGGLLAVGPSGLIIKRKAFEIVNGFDEYGMPSDNHFTLKIAGRYPLVAMMRDLFWWRLHDEQVFSQNINNHRNIINNYLFNTDIIVHHSPLDSIENNLIIRNQKKILYANLLRLCFKNGRPALALNLLKQYFKVRQV